jgi:hypothetical protein
VAVGADPAADGVAAALEAVAVGSVAALAAVGAEVVGPAVAGRKGVPACPYVA